MPLEGMIRVETLGQDYFEYDAERQELRGTTGNEAYRLGQGVKVRLIGVNPGRLEINLALHGGGPRPARKGQKKALAGQTRSPRRHDAVKAARVTRASSRSEIPGKKRKKDDNTRSRRTGFKA